MTDFDNVRITAKVFGGQLVPVCEAGRHAEHDGLTCEEADQQIAAARAVLDADIERALRSLVRTPMSEVPAALRGPRWKDTSA